MLSVIFRRSRNVRVNNSLTSTLLLCLSILFMLPKAMAAEFNWQFVNLYARGSAYAQIYQNFANNIELMSNGKIKVTLVYADEMAGKNSVFAAVKSGAITMGAPFQPMYASELPSGIVEVGLPGMTSDVGELSALFHEKGWGKVLTAAYAKHNLVWLEPYMQLPVYILTKKPINRLADFRGLRIRAPGAYGQFLAKLGAQPVSLPWNAVYSNLKAGNIDGTIGSNLIDHRYGHHTEVAKYMYPLPISGTQVLPILVNKTAWQKLPKHLQAVVRGASALHASEQLSKSRIWEQQAIEAMVVQGMQWSPSPDESEVTTWQSTAEGLWSEYANTDEYSSQLLDILQQ